MAKIGSTTISEPVAIIAGRGSFPIIMASALKGHSIPYVILGLEGFVDQAKPYCQQVIRYDKWQQMRDFFEAHHVRSVVFVGKVDRPKLSNLRPDALLLKYLPKIGLSFAGDDQVMRKISQIFEDVFSLQILDPKLLLAQEDWPLGALGKYSAKPQDRADIERGVGVLRTIAHADFGQSVVIESARVLGVEALEGTDDLMLRVAKFISTDQASGVLVKMLKTGQDKRLDPPVIGLETLRVAKEANLSGVCIGRGVVILNLAETIAFADQHGLFIDVVAD